MVRSLPLQANSTRDTLSCSIFIFALYSPCRKEGLMSTRLTVVPRDQRYVHARLLSPLSPYTLSPSDRATITVRSVETPKPKLLDQVRESMRTRHYSPRTEKTYVHWIKRFIFFHDKRHPREMGEVEIGQFLSALATEAQVSASTQNQALNALLFLYRVVLGKPLVMSTELSARKGQTGFQSFSPAKRSAPSLQGWKGLSR
jgi:hypothetical protein